MPRTDTDQRLTRIEESLARIEGVLALLVPPSEEREHIAEATEHVTAVAEATPIQAAQLDAIALALIEHMSEAELRDAMFHTQQLGSIMQGTRTDIVEMRATLLRLEAMLRGRVEDEERTVSSRRKAE